MAGSVLALLPKRSLFLVWAATACLTNPKAAFYIMWLLLVKTPYFCLKRVIENLAPKLVMKDVSGETVLITGAASGIGKLLATKFARLGSKVALLDVNANAVQQAAAEISKESGVNAGRISHFACDLADREATYEAMAKVKEQIGDVTILVNNAGIVTGKKFLDAPDKAMELTMKVNTNAHFWTLKSCLPAMMSNNRGHIVTIASSAGIAGVAGLSDYCASKFGAFGCNESLRNELRKAGRNGVHTTVVCPFYIKTGMFAGAAARFPRLMNLLEPEDVATRIMQAIRCDQEMLCMPAAVNLVFLAQLLPVPVMDRIGAVLGVHDSMDDFKGRS